MPLSLLQRQLVEWCEPLSSAVAVALLWLGAGKGQGVVCRDRGVAAYKIRTQETSRTTLQLWGEMEASFLADLWRKQQKPSRNGI